MGLEDVCHLQRRLVEPKALALGLVPADVFRVFRPRRAVQALAKLGTAGETAVQPLAPALQRVQGRVQVGEPGTHRIQALEAARPRDLAPGSAARILAEAQAQVQHPAAQLGGVAEQLRDIAGLAPVLQLQVPGQVQQLAAADAAPKKLPATSGKLMGLVRR